MSIVLERLTKIQADIYKSKNKLNRDVKIIAVSKTFPINQVEPLIKGGHIHFGENKVQEAEKKWHNFKNVNNSIKLHMIGKLQTNKVKKAIKIFDYIHSLDSIKLADHLNKCEEDTKKKLSYFIQVNFANEKQKSGIPILEVKSFYNYCKNKTKLNIIGIMCYPPFGLDPTNFFDKAQKLNKELGFEELSMGMSNDFHKALDYGSTFLRLGSTIFGSRES